MKRSLFSVWCRGRVLVACAFSLLLLSCGGGGGGSSSDDYLAAVEENGGGGSRTVADGFILVSGGSVTGGDKFTLSGQTSDEYKGAFVAGRNVTVSSFYICDHEVTQAEYQEVMGTNPSEFSSGAADGEVQGKRPVEKVSWYDAITYCNKRSIKEGLTPCYTVSGVNFSGSVTVPSTDDSTWNAVAWNSNANGYRLPTEVEWEYAARGGAAGCAAADPNDFAGTDSSSNLGSYAWYNSNSGDKTHEVKKKTKNSLDLYDMSGNVYEWCWDWHSEPLSGSTPAKGASTGSFRVFRGGSWIDNMEAFCSLAYRSSGADPSARDDNMGFRVVRSAE